MKYLLVIFVIGIGGGVVYAFVDRLAGVEIQGSFTAIRVAGGLLAGWLLFGVMQ